MGDRNEQPNLPTGQGTSGESKVPGQSRRKLGPLSFIVSFPRQVLVTPAHLEIGKYTLPNFSFVERMEKSKPILFLQMS